MPTKARSLYRPGPWAPCDVCGEQTRCRTFAGVDDYTPRHMICEMERADRTRRRREEFDRRDEQAYRRARALEGRPRWARGSNVDAMGLWP